MVSAANVPLHAGALIAARYRLDRLLGEGGMGVVWAAREVGSERPLALKFLRTERESDPKNIQRFFREARAAMGVSHPNIARVEAVLETPNGAPFMVMELLHGESLRALLDRRTFLPAPECARLMVQVVDAVAAAHASGVIHRDLKPENIFLVGDPSAPHVRVLDFGIAKRITSADPGQPATESLTATGTLLGTPLYMAPEQIFGDVIDTRTDVWSLGIVLYEALAGRRPTDGDGFGQIIKRITTAQFPPLEQVRHGLPGRVRRLVGGMLRLDKNQRPPLAEIRDVLGSVAVMGDDLVPSARNPILSAPTLEDRPLVGMRASTTAGIESRRDTSTSPPIPAPSGGSKAGTIALIAGGAFIACALAIGGTWQYMTRGGATPPGIIGVDAMLTLNDASNALVKRDGPKCLQALDKFDALSNRPGPPTTDPKAQHAITRASCMALAGDCEGAKKLYVPAFTIAAASSKPDKQFIDGATDQFAASWCEGNVLDPRDAVLRADTRLMTAGYHKTTAAECRESHATIVRLLPKVPASGPLDPVSIVPRTLEDHTAVCLAWAGDCDGGVRVFRDDWNKRIQTTPSPSREHDMRVSWDARTAPTPCKGKP